MRIAVGCPPDPRLAQGQLLRRLSMQRSLKQLTSHLSGWQRDLRTYLVRRGIETVCGTSTFNPTTAAASDIPLVRAAVGMIWLRVLGAVGLKSIVATSGLGHKFVCHLGDLAEHPFYHRSAYKKELELCAAWLREGPDPVMYDVGANDGFFSSQIAQLMGGQPIQIYAFEPVPTTFAKLVESVFRLGLEDCIHPIAAAVTDHQRLVHVSYSKENSLYAQVTPHGLNPRAGGELALVPAVTLDQLSSIAKARPTLLKIDVEGSEVAVLRGAGTLLSGRSRPAIAIEYSPLTLSECGENFESLAERLEGYNLYYVDDHQGQKLPFGAPIGGLEEIDWTCNLFAVPAGDELSGRWSSASGQARHRLGLLAP
jgi:FkbM family methyltransferase